MTCTGYSVAVANSKAFGGGMYVAPDAKLDDGLFDVVVIGEIGKLRYLANLPKVFKGTHVEEDEVTEARRGRRDPGERRPRLRRLRRRRAPQPTCPPTLQRPAAGAAGDRAPAEAEA